MKKMLMVFTVLVVSASTVHAVPFSPTLLKISAEPLIQYDFDGSILTIPVQVSGSSAGIIFSVFTSDMADKIGPTTNGFIGWHYVNKVDTCIYYSNLRSFSPGMNEIRWDGRDQDGGVVAAGKYTYYMWAYDNQGSKTLMSYHITSADIDWAWSYEAEIQEYDEDGLPLTNPIFYRPQKRWVIGGDPMDSTLVETASIQLAQGWSLRGDPTLHPTDFDYFYVGVKNNTSFTGGIQKLKWVPGGTCEIQSEWGNSGYSDLFSIAGGWSPGPGTATDGMYLYTGDENHVSSSEPDADFYIYDFDGMMVDYVDLTEWWSNPDNLAAGGQMNGGPITFSERNGRLVLNSHASCLVQMVNPLAYLDSGDTEDFYIWTNGNGDYVLDHNFEETANLPWVCNDYNVGVEKYTIAADNNFWSTSGAYDAGAVSFGLLAPDGTGISYMTFAGETGGWKEGPMVIDCGSPYDGFYEENKSNGGKQYVFDIKYSNPGLYFIGHDSIKGVITTAVHVEKDSPDAFSVAQNSPNPFNPTTTISFNLVKAGDIAVEIFNVAGQKVDTILDGYVEAGQHAVVWNASRFSAGVYFYTVKGDNFSKTMKMTLIK